jgi:hypothetical protein
MSNADRFENIIDVLLANGKRPYVRIYETFPLHFTPDANFLSKWNNVELHEIIAFNDFTMMIFSVANYKEE